MFSINRIVKDNNKTKKIFIFIFHSIFDNYIIVLLSNCDCKYRWNQKIEWDNIYTIYLLIINLHFLLITLRTYLWHSSIIECLLHGNWYQLIKPPHGNTQWSKCQTPDQTNNQSNIWIPLGYTGAHTILRQMNIHELICTWCQFYLWCVVEGWAELLAVAGWKKGSLWSIKTVPKAIFQSWTLS